MRPIRSRQDLAQCAKAAAIGDLPYFRLDRPAWQSRSRDQWTEVAEPRPRRPPCPGMRGCFSPSASRGIEPFFARNDLSGVVRMIEASRTDSRRLELLQARPPFGSTDELRSWKRAT